MEQESKIRKILFNEVSIVIGIGAFICSFLSAYYDIRTQLALINHDITVIRTNELVHVQEAMDEIKTRNDEADERQSAMQNEITRILTIIGK